MNNLMRDYVVSLVSKGERIDGRKLDEYRKPIKIEYGISAKSADGSARVTIGETVVVAGIKMEIGEPFPDKPDEGTIIAGVELLPLSSPDFESGPPNIESIELARSVVDRGIRESKAVDFKKLCINKGEKVWLVYIDIYSINDCGNLADAIGLAALAALKDTKIPKEKDGVIDYKVRSSKVLPLNQLPIPITLLKIKDKIIVDPCLDEENAFDARLTVTIVEDGRICALQKGGDKALTNEDVDLMIKLAVEKSNELRKVL